MNFSTARLCDTYADSAAILVADPIFKAYGGKTAFAGQITTLKVFEDQVLIAAILAEPGIGRVLVIDGGGSHRIALLDLQLAEFAIKNGWQGLVIYGCLRDSAAMAPLPIGIRALHTHPLQAHRKGLGERGITVTFAGIPFKNDHYLYADADGIIVSTEQLL